MKFALSLRAQAATVGNRFLSVSLKQQFFQVVVLLAVFCYSGSSYSQTLPGDVNNDGSVDVYDVGLIYAQTLRTAGFNNAADSVQSYCSSPTRCDGDGTQWFCLKLPYQDCAGAIAFSPLNMDNYHVEVAARNVASYFRAAGFNQTADYIEQNCEPNNPYRSCNSALATSPLVMGRDQLDCQPGESNEACAQRSVFKDEIGLGVPSQTVFLTVPSLTVPGQSTPSIPAQTVSTPAIQPQSVSTPEIPIPKICTPADIICVGPFTIPPQTIISTPGVPSQSVTTPPVGPIPVTPPVTTPPVTILATTTGLDLLVTPHAGELGSIGPVPIFVPTPFGPIPVTICASTCPVPVLPEAALNGSVTVTVTVGSTIVSRTVPVKYP